MKSLVVGFMVVLAIELLMVEPGQAITCQQVDASLGPCIAYLTGGGSPSHECCSGLGTLKNLTPYTADRRQACECLKAAASRFPNIREDLASSLPQACHVGTNVPISKNIRCSE
ncbi:Non-specific lipid-transfer protein [Quillaja saponaria]|uniref:Non-specific lipid-transfer protein n=1 Tax=Quillaja saponaria TaxID=32244 RepID=A0AAD7LMF7_QUISA|nr:Non-specific lipid-transfer protein [Quillaja saponaria]